MIKMRIPDNFQQNIDKEQLLEDNELFAFYMKTMVKDYLENQEYNILDAQYDDFIIPGKLELKLDGYEATIDLSSDILAAIYQIIMIRNDALQMRFKEEEYVDLREYF
jgi:hypothetical protein